MAIIAEVQDNSGKKYQAKASISPIKNYLIVFKMKLSSGLKFINMEKNGWVGIYANGIQDAEILLKKAIEKYIGKDGKADCVVIQTHGRIIEVHNDKQQVIRSETSFNTNNSKKYRIDTSDFIRKNRVEVEIPEEVKRKEEEFNKKRDERIDRAKAREERTRARAERANSNNKDEKEKDEQDYWDDKREETEDIQEEGLDKKEEEVFKIQIEAETRVINEKLTEQVKKDIVSLKNIIECVEVNKNYIQCSCHSALDERFMEEVLKLTNYKVNSIGIKDKSLYYEDQAQSLIDGDEIFIRLKGINLAKKSNGNKVVKFSTGGSKTYYENIKLVAGGIKFIGET